MSAYGKNIWGGVVNAPSSPAPGEKILRVQASGSELGRLVDHWSKLSAEERPELLGLTASAGAQGSAPSLELLLAQGENLPHVVVSVAAAPGFARPSAVWPYSLWWEEELRTFSGVEFAGMIPERDATWRPL